MFLIDVYMIIHSFSYMYENFYLYIIISQVFFSKGSILYLIITTILLILETSFFTTTKE